MSKTKIEWPEETWNPVKGFTKIGDGYLNCYTEQMSKRLQAMGQNNYRNCFEVTCHEYLYEQPKHTDIFQVLTKRADRLLKIWKEISWS